MALFSIPTSQQFPWYILPIQLSGERFNLELRYNTRLDRWILSVFDQSLSPVLLSVPLLINRDLMTQYRTLSIPQGTMFCVDESGQQLEPTLSSFLTDHTLYYIDQSA